MHTGNEMNDIPKLMSIARFALVTGNYLRSGAEHRLWMLNPR